MGVGSQCVLVVDDSPETLEIISTLLEANGYEVRRASGGHEALALAGERRPDLVLLDLHMADLDGLEVCRRLRDVSRGERLPVVFVSSERDALLKVEAFRAGAVDYVNKPFEFSEVVARVESQLELVRLEREAAARAFELEAANARLRRLEETRAQFTASLVHDLKNTLTPVLNNSRWLLDSESEEGERRDALRDVHLAARHLHRLALAMLDVARADERGLEPQLSRVDLPAWLDEALELPRLQLRSTPGRLEAHAEGAAVFDAALLARVVQNLCDNAIRYARTAGPIEVRAQARADGGLTLSVRDHGEGLGAERWAQLGQRWSTGAPTGHGLGLAFCQRAVAAHGGTLRAEPAAPRGTLVIAELPARQVR